MLRPLQGTFWRLGSGFWRGEIKVGGLLRLHAAALCVRSFICGRLRADPGLSPRPGGRFEFMMALQHCLRELGGLGPSGRFGLRAFNVARGSTEACYAGAASGALQYYGSGSAARYFLFRWNVAGAVSISTCVTFGTGRNTIALLLHRPSSHHKYEDAPLV
jgi:hypothetical protein